ncbi:MAG: type II toxin-antitoxin system HicA family toxin [Phycisphaerales bacterium]|jgi:predicted RNA binding protein YcfA (HicA-like mRNA interferase family)|nr:type II toxin-antitoxin system HicA family toxin [Phycisphaerales bacterium]MBT7170150.1 type II toxin-antitoxin system HicA family toxin [Phycisphaerales bacterium]
MHGRELIKIMKKHGWQQDRINGSHHIMVKEGQRSIPVPVHGKRDIPKGLANAILKQAGLKGIRA